MWGELEVWFYKKLPLSSKSFQKSQTDLLSPSSQHTALNLLLIWILYILAALNTLHRGGYWPLLWKFKSQFIYMHLDCCANIKDTNQVFYLLERFIFSRFLRCHIPRSSPIVLVRPSSSAWCLKVIIPGSLSSFLLFSTTFPLTS